ncbi:MAG: T9SS type A sorting domain-containing protein [Chitinophagales bacterium]|nr:T9SS type A sorting domain-containing protein [Chitinophagales bacterium]
MKYSFLLVILFIGLYSKAQNLVPNPSFEDTISCPNDFNQIERAIGWINFGASPDYFNKCSSFIGSTVPSSYGGYQEPSTGHAYAGIITYDIPPPGNYREFIGALLLQSLEIGSKYKISLEVSSGYNVHQFEIIECFCNKLGVLFSTIPYSVPFPAPINNYSHFAVDSIIQDTLNWVNISGCFIADSNYKYVIIGNFFDDLHTDWICDSINMNSFAYYFIDDVSVYKVSEDCVTGGINYLNTETASIRIFPNPSHDFFYIQNLTLTNIQIDIFNKEGKKIISKISPPNIKMEIRVNEWENGIYYVKSKTNGYTIFQKIIIIHP